MNRICRIIRNAAGYALRAYMVLQICLSAFPVCYCLCSSDAIGCCRPEPTSDSLIGCDCRQTLCCGPSIAESISSIALTANHNCHSQIELPSRGNCQCDENGCLCICRLDLNTWLPAEIRTIPAAPVAVLEWHETLRFPQLRGRESDLPPKPAANQRIHLLLSVWLN